MEHYYNNIGENWFSYQNLYKNAVAQYDNTKFVEIGSWKGRSVSFLGVEIKNQNKNIEVFCVDTWAGSIDHTDFDTIIPSDIYDAFIKNIEPIEDIITPMKMTSLEGSSQFPDYTFDMIFIDASHLYENVLDDMNAWFPKLRKGGLFAGHDYGTWDGVTKAVDKWVKDHDIKNLNTDGAEHTWFFYKE